MRRDQEAQSILPSGTLIRERYLVKSLLGQGSSGAVYLVEDQRVKQNKQHVFALKEMIGLSEQERYRFTFGSVALTQLNHPSWPRIHHIFNDDRRSRVCVVMEYMEGADQELFSSIEEFWQALQAPVNERKPTGDEVALQTTTSTPTVTQQIPVPAAVLTPLSPKRPGRTPSPLLFLKRFVVPLVLLILLCGAGAGIWSLTQSHHPPSLVPKQAATPHLALSPPALPPTPSPGIYPDIVGSYTGTLVDVSSKASAPMILQAVHQIGGTINGYFTLGSPLEVSGPFRGMMDISKRFQFTVTDATGHTILFLEGAIQSASSLSGDFYRCASTPTEAGKCSRAFDGYGIWNALLITSR